MNLLAYVHSFKNRKLNKNQFSVVIVNESGREIGSFLGDADFSPDLMAINKLIRDYNPKNLVCYTRSSKLHNILYNKKFEKYLNSDWDVLKKYVKDNTFECKYLNKENEFMLKAQSNLNEKNDSSRKWTVRKDI